MTDAIGPNLRPTSDFFAELLKISEMKIDKVKEGDTFEEIRNYTFDSAKEALETNMRAHPMRQALFQVLVEQKEKTRISSRMTNFVEDPNTDSMTRLDNMLVAEGIVGPAVNINISPDVPPAEQEEYRQKLREVRLNYEDKMHKSAQASQSFQKEVQNLMDRHREFRPITKENSDQVGHSIARKFNKLPEVFKQAACEAVIHLKKRFFDARRKRRNFAKSSTDILNEYFQANIDHPYPSEEIKQALAVQCNISVAQVSNWFGNKRIRYKKAMAKEKETKRDHVSNVKRQATQAMSSYGLLPGMVNPYQMMMPGPQFPMGMPQFNLPMYDPAMMAQYQQSMQQSMPKQ